VDAHDLVFLTVYLVSDFQFRRRYAFYENNEDFKVSGYRQSFAKLRLPIPPAAEHVLNAPNKER